MPIIRRRRRLAEESEEEEEGNTSTQFAPADPEFDAEEDVDMNQSSEQREQLARKLVRYALSCEYSRQHIRRTDISAKVLGPSSRQFRDVFAEAQMMLRETFGMEMVELPKPEKVTVQQKRAAQKSESQGSSSTNVYVLVNTLPAKYRTAEILTPARAPTVEQESTYIGFYSFIIAVIYLSGGSLPEAKLDRYLRQTRADQNTPIDRTDKVLQRMIKDGYIARIKDTSTGEEMIDYIVGPRGKVEVGPEGVAELAKTVWGEDGLEDLNSRLERTFALTRKDDPPPTQKRTRGRDKRQRNEGPQEEEEDDDHDEEGDESPNE